MKTDKKRMWFLILVGAIVLMAVLFFALRLHTGFQKEIPPSVISEVDAAAVRTAFYQQVDDADITEITRHGAYYFVLGKLKPIDVAPLGNIMVYVMAEREGVLQVLDRMGCDSILSPGFTASVLQSNKMTIIFGGVSDQFMVYPGGEKVVPFDSIDIIVKYGRNESLSAPVQKNESFVFVIDGFVDISDIQFSQEGTCLTGYMALYNTPPEIFQHEIDGHGDGQADKGAQATGAAPFKSHGDGSLEPVAGVMTERTQ